MHDSAVTALDRANAEDAVLPLPKVLDIFDKMDTSDEAMMDAIASESQAKFEESRGICCTFAF